MRPHLQQADGLLLSNLRVPSCMLMRCCASRMHCCGVHMHRNQLYRLPHKPDWTGPMVHMTAYMQCICSQARAGCSLSQSLRCVGVSAAHITGWAVAKASYTLLHVLRYAANGTEPGHRWLLTAPCTLLCV